MEESRDYPVALDTRTANVYYGESSSERTRIGERGDQGEWLQRSAERSVLRQDKGQRTAREVMSDKRQRQRQYSSRRDYEDEQP